jgi:catechol 2,3-dioxygenase-like lactoylglutathione lyase family enzyme
MKLLPLILTLAPLALAQLPPGNEAGVAMGHLHLNVKDVDESKKFWVDQLGATPVEMGRAVVLKFPGTLVFLNKKDPTGPTVGSSVDHVGFLVRDLDKESARWKANSVKILMENPANRQLFLMSPEGVKIEIYEDKSISAPIVNHHIHFWTNSVEDLEAFCKKLEASGVKFDIAYRKVPALGISIAFFTDPWGTYIELTEGLSKL